MVSVGELMQLLRQDAGVSLAKSTLREIVWKEVSPILWQEEKYLVSEIGKDGYWCATSREDIEQLRKDKATVRSHAEAWQSKLMRYDKIEEKLMNRKYPEHEQNELRLAV